MGGGGTGHSDPEIRGARSQKNFFRLFGSHFGLKIKGGPWPLSWIRHGDGFFCLQVDGTITILGDL